ncbi:hypothetical protein [Bartonella sp. CB189]|uniref:hypothetical protein n=1 Tax=Bartonella sp. CB189 TaxID=3112254 RepID=UPI002F9632CA
MERRIDAMRRLYRKKIYNIISRVGVIFLCVLLCGFVMKETADYFFSTKEIVQKNTTALDIPTFDLRVYCKEIAASVLPDVKKEVYYRCANLERNAYFVIRDMWSNLSDHSKEKCVKMVRPGDGSYFLLRDCFMNEKNNKGLEMRNYF